LHDAPATQIETLDRRGRVADIETGDRPAIDLSSQKDVRVRALHRERLFVIRYEHDLAGA
jgi:hypothetical protein